MTLFFKELGNKGAPLMVFLHGGGVSGWMWDKQVEYFTHYHCLVPDLPGQGLSKKEDSFSIKTSAEIIVDLIEEKAEGKKVIIIGFSLGAQILVQILSIKPHLIDYAIINSALVRPITYAKRLIKPSILLTAPLIKNRTFSRIQAKTLYIGKNYFEQYYNESCQMKLETLILILEENMSFSIPENFTKATGQILVIAGEKEKGMMKKSVHDLVNANPNCKGLIIPDVGHGLSLAKPELFNGMVEEWVHEESHNGNYF